MRGAKSVSTADRTTNAECWPLDTATLSRCRSSRKPIPRDTSECDDAAIDTMATGASWPWNLSTVPTATSTRPASSRVWRSWPT